jgi:DNA-binding transcriptional LysR family regulator
MAVTGLFTEPRVAALPASHASSGLRPLFLTDLAGDVLQPAGYVPGWRGVTALPFPYGHDQDGLAAASPTIEEKLELVAAGRGIVILPASATRYYSRPDVTYARVAGLPDTEVCLVVESRRRSAVLRELVRIAQAVPPADFAGRTDGRPASVGAR